LTRGTSGEIILTWKKSIFACQARSVKENVVTADLRLNMDSKVIRVT
jgi:hypothetical protein